MLRIMLETTLEEHNNVVGSYGVKIMPGIFSGFVLELWLDGHQNPFSLGTLRSRMAMGNDQGAWV